MCSGRRGLAWGLALVGLGAACIALQATTDETGEAGGANQLPHFQDVLRLLRTNLPGVTEADLNRAMVEGMLDHFRPRVVLQDGGAEAEVTSEGRGGMRRSALYDGTVGYLGVQEVSPGLAQQLAAARASMEATNKVEGWVLDLRACGGRDYRAAAQAAGLFVNAEQVLISYDDVKLTSAAGGEAGLPVVVLVNGETTGSAEALAGALREAGPAVVMGSRTAGEAFAMRSFDLDNGQRLFIAGGGVSVGREVSLEGGLVPDLEVVSPVEQERVWVEDPYRAPEGEAGREPTEPVRTRFDEAALLRQHEGLTNDPASGATVGAPGTTREEPRLQDHALERALALLKGLERVRGGIRR